MTQKVIIGDVTFTGELAESFLGWLDMRDRLLFSGVRVPSRDEIADAIAGQSGFRWDQVPPLTRNAYLGMADAVLALMDPS